MKKLACIAVAALAATMSVQTVSAQEKDNASRRTPSDQPIAPVSGVQSSDRVAGKPAMPAMAATPLAAATPMDPAMEAHWAKEAAMGGMYEVQLAQLAVQKAQSEDVKRLAQHIIDDHTKANQQLMQIAQSKKMELPSELDEIHKLKLAKWQEKQGAHFDKHYVITQTADHVKDILEYRGASENLRDPDLKAFAAAQLPALQIHYQMASQLSGWSANDSARPAGASERGSGSDTARPGATGDTTGRPGNPSIPSGTPGGAGPGANGTGTPGTGSGTNGTNVGTGVNR